MHEVLRALVERLGPEIFDDPDNFRGALDDVLDEDASLGDQNLVIDAVRLGAYASMSAMLRQGGDPGPTVAQAGARLARDRGGDDLASATWACACLAYAIGAVGEAEVRAHRTARRQPPPPPPPPAPVTVPAPAVPPVPLPTYVEAAPAPVGGRWLVPVLVVIALVAATTVGVLGAQRLGGDDPPAAVTPSETPTATPTSSPPTGSPSTTPPSTSPTTSPPTAPPTTSEGPAPIRATIEYTCGSTGDGDCFLSERAGPRAASRLVRNHDEGRTLQVTCQVVGQEVYSSVLDRTSRVWAMTTTGGFVAAVFLRGIDKYRVTTPC